MAYSVRQSIELGTKPDGPLFKPARNRKEGAAKLCPKNKRSASIELECLTSVNDILALEADWRTLFEKTSEPFSYFQSFDWCKSWLDQFASDELKLRVYVVRHNDTPVVIWPLVKIQSRAFATILVPLTDPYCQYTVMLRDPEIVDLPFGKRVLSEIKTRSDADLIALETCPEGSFLNLLTEGEGFCEGQEQVSSILDLSEISSWDEYHASLPRNQRKDRNKRRNKLAGLGELEYEVVPAGTPRYRELVKQGLEFKQVWLEATGRRTDLMGSDSTASFLSSLDATAQKGSITFGAVAHCLKLDGRPIGIEVGMICNRDYYSYLGAIDWDMRKYSPGKVQLEFAQKWANEAGILRFDFLSDPSEYKAYWTNSSQAVLTCFIPVTTKGYLYTRLWKSALKPYLKRFYQKTGSANRVFMNRLFAAIGKR